MKESPIYHKIKSPRPPRRELEEIQEDFDFAAFLGCDSDATEEEIDQMWENQMC